MFWLDADLIIVPSNIISLLYHANPTGVSAPLVLLDSAAIYGRRIASGDSNVDDIYSQIINGNDKEMKFYDTAAFVQENEKIQHTSLHGKAECGHRNYGSVTSFKPYYNPSSINHPPHPPSTTSSASSSTSSAEKSKSDILVPFDSVGTTYLIPANVYRWTSTAMSSFNIRHYAHVLTEHCPVVHAAKYLLGLEVMLVTHVKVLHADLPAYGESFHGGAFLR